MPLISNQPQYSMLWRVIEAEVVPTCEREGIGQIVWSPIAQGVLTGKYRPGAGAAGGLAGHRRDGRRGSSSGSSTTTCWSGCSGCARWREDCGLSMAQLAIAWVLQNDNVAAAIIGATRPEQVTENVKAAGVRLDAEVLRRIDEILGDVVERDPAKTG